MNNPIKTTLAGLIATATLGFAQVSPETGNDADDQDVLTLSPFSVEESQDSGYAATSTLAGSRIRSDVRDLGSSLSIITKDFLIDTGATDGESLLSNIGNVEVGGVLGNFSDVNLDNNSTNPTRLDPQSSQRIRGLVSASTTRDYFTTNIPFDSYNTSRVEVNRGPNSVLFGLGSPGGVINNSTNVARIGNNSGEVSFRFDHRGSHRGTLDINQTLIEDRFAIRLDVLNERTNYQQDPAFETDARYFAAFDLTLRKNTGDSWFGKTSLRGSYESGRTIRNPPDVVPPTDGFSSWFVGLGGQEALNRFLAVPGATIGDLGVNVVTKEQVLSAINAGLIEVPAGQTADAYATAQGKFIPNTFRDRIRNTGNVQNAYAPIFLFPAVNYNSVAAGTQPGWNDPDLAGIQGIMGRWRPNGSPTQDFQISNSATGGVGFRAASINDRNIFDYHNNLFQGTTNNVDTDFDVKQVILEQSLFDGQIGMELAWNSQTRKRNAFTAFSSGNSKKISIDISQWQAPADSNRDKIPDTLANENAGRPVVIWDDNTVTESWNDQETLRATVYGTLDTRNFLDGTLGKILGKHTLTGLYEDRENNGSNRQTRGSWWSDNGKYPGSADISNGDNNNFRRIVKSQVYLGPNVATATSPSQVRIDGPIKVDFPKIGDTYGIWYFDNANSIDAGVKGEWRIIENVQNLGISKQTLESKAIALQSTFLWDNIVGMWAWREDEQNAWRQLQADAPTGPTGSLGERLDDPGILETDGNYNPGLWRLEDTPFGIDKDSTTTWSVVGKYPENWLGDLPWGLDFQGHYYEAESFQPASGQVNVLNQPLANPLGTTKEYGVTVSFFDNRLSVRYNHFETVNANARTNLGGQLGQVVGRMDFFLTRIADSLDSGLSLFPSDSDRLLTTTTSPSNRQRLTGTDADLIGVNSYEEYFAKLLQILPPEVQSIYNYRVVTNPNGTHAVFSDPLNGSLQSTRDFVATGHEIDVTGKVTKNISISLNVAQQETVTSNTGPVAIPLANEINQRIKDLGLFDIRDSPYQVETGAIGASRYAAVLRTLQVEKALDNTKSAEQREWRVNLTGRYDFTEGRFKGLAVGGSLRYQSEIAAGYPQKLDEFGNAVPDVANPWLGPDELNGDMFIRYRRKLTDKINWSVQLNARNLYRANGSNDIPVTYNPDGQVAVIRIPNEQQFFLTNTFSF